MARITDRLLVQPIERDVVLIDESSGQEVVIPARAIRRVIHVLDYFSGGSVALRDSDGESGGGS